ncbi:uncharacterized protein K489DRAFT_327304 [Dissoconium aciculare CBS 342.82]|uniref:Chromatin modification-related protein n=1 Tax=Dissoconium aciculare CBS 342.82 TaxID=1314786 RepID=A0A6J3LSC9_9PEZI|nr:uncharacterized protein K489DRAFT_327304 [Dissoconium aciculare CBS 342.82]KAF1818538.1 hypothetical protein K489DRAFT_327304 [Dissoconium aciculare CBS 342.82]
MSLAQPEDAASVLEQFVHDVANIPAEVTHLLEEIQAKDLQIQAFKDEINKRDTQLQKWVRTNGGHVANPKEDAFSNIINDCYDKCDILQAEKSGLAEKAVIVLERQIKRLDIGLRGLANTEQFPADWNGPSMLKKDGNGTSISAAIGGAAVDGSTDSKKSTTGLPLQVVSGNAPGGANSSGGGPAIANAAQLRLAQNTAGSARSNSVSGASTPSSVPRAQREGSSEANKRRRLNASLGSLPAASSNLRQSSLGPGTPKAGTPVPAGGATNKSSRAGSAQPPAQKKAAPGTTPQPASANRKLAPPPSSRNRNRSRPKKTGDRRRQLARDRNASPTTNASPSIGSVSEDEDDSASSVHVNDDGDDETLYCLCQKVSFGDMVGCDNDDCEYQWFHYNCVGVTEEPKGEWLCPTCRNMPRNKLKISKEEK